MNDNGHMTRLPPKVMEEYLRRQAKLMRECYASRCAPDYEDAANCIRDLRYTQTASPLLSLMDLLYFTERAIENVRGARTSGAQLVRAMQNLQELKRMIDGEIAKRENAV